MIFELNKETIDFLCKKKITFSQFCLCLLLYKKDIPSMIKLTNELGYLGDSLLPRDKDENGKTKYITEIDDLIDKGFLLTTDLVKDHTYDLDNFILTSKFTEDFLVDTDIQDAPQELWDLYPKKIFINGVETSSKSCDYDEFANKYLGIIKNSIKKHKIVMSKLNAYVANNGYAQMGIMKWIGSRDWENIEDNVGGKTRSI